MRQVLIGLGQLFGRSVSFLLLYFFFKIGFRLKNGEGGEAQLEQMGFGQYVSFSSPCRERAAQGNWVPAWAGDLYAHAEYVDIDICWCRAHRGRVCVRTCMCICMYIYISNL